MAFTEAQRLKLCKILQIVPEELQYQIDFLSTDLTATVQTSIEAEITLWDAGAGTKTTKIHPRESNRGVETDPSKARSDIQRNIALLLGRPDWAAVGGSVEYELTRG